MRVFLSHKADQKKYARDLKRALGRHGIEAFVAHEDIRPTEKWRESIRDALSTCDALVALLHEGFFESEWTDQEIGWALGRGIPTYSVCLGCDPRGLLADYQAFAASDGIERLAAEIAEKLDEGPKPRGHQPADVTAAAPNATSDPAGALSSTERTLLITVSIAELRGAPTDLSALVDGSGLSLEETRRCLEAVERFGFAEAKALSGDGETYLKVHHVSLTEKGRIAANWIERERSAAVRIRPETVQPLPRDCGAAIVVENHGPATATHLLIEILGTGDGGSPHEVLETMENTARFPEIRPGQTRHLPLLASPRPFPFAVRVGWNDDRPNRQSADFMVERLGTRREGEV